MVLSNDLLYVAVGLLLAAALGTAWRHPVFGAITAALSLVVFATVVWGMDSPYSLAECTDGLVQSFVLRCGPGYEMTFRRDYAVVATVVWGSLCFVAWLVGWLHTLRRPQRARA